MRILLHRSSWKQVSWCMYVFESASSGAAATRATHMCCVRAFLPVACVMTSAVTLLLKCNRHSTVHSDSAMSQGRCTAFATTFHRLTAMLSALAVRMAKKTAEVGDQGLPLRLLTQARGLPLRLLSQKCLGSLLSLVLSLGRATCGSEIFKLGRSH